MSSEAGIGLEYPVRVMGGDGTILWAGCGFPATVANAISGESSATISPGQAVAFDASGLIVQPWDQATTVAPKKQVLSVKLATTTGNLDSFVGVALTKAVAGAPVIVCKRGVVPVLSSAVGTIRQNCVASATAGTVTPQNNAGTAPGGTLGHVVKIGGTTGGATDSGSSSYPIVAVNPF